MKKIPVSPTVLKQRAKKIKKGKSIPTHQALNEAAVENGWESYKHFLNEWESNRTPVSKSEVGALLKKLSTEKDLFKKLDIAVPFVQNNKISFPEMFEIFEQFRESEEAVQIICENSYFLFHVVNSMMLQYFQASKEDVQALPLNDHFVAKNVVAEEFECKLITERLSVKGLYTIEFEFEHLTEVPVDDRKVSHFNRDPMFGQFEMIIDRNKQCSIANPTICELSEDGIPTCTRFKLGPEYLAIVKDQHNAEAGEFKMQLKEKAGNSKSE